MLCLKQRGSEWIHSPESDWNESPVTFSDNPTIHIPVPQAYLNLHKETTYKWMNGGPRYLLIKIFSYSVKNIYLFTFWVWARPIRDDCTIPGIISANDRRRYIVTSSLIGRAHTQNEPCLNAPPCSNSKRTFSLFLFGELLIDYTPWIHVDGIIYTFDGIVYSVLARVIRMRTRSWAAWEVYPSNRSKTQSYWTTLIHKTGLGYMYLMFDWKQLFTKVTWSWIYIYIYALMKTLSLNKGKETVAYYVTSPIWSQ